MTDVKIFKDEIQRVKPSKTHSKGCHLNPRRAIRFKLDNLDFSLQPGDMEDFKTRPMFFSIRGDSYAAISAWNKRQRTYNILKTLRPVHRDLPQYSMKNKIGDGDGDTIPGDSTTKLPEIATDRSLWIPVHKELMSRICRTTQATRETSLLESLNITPTEGTVPIGVKPSANGAPQSLADPTEIIMLKILQTVVAERHLYKHLKYTLFSDEQETDLTKLKQQNDLLFKRNAILIETIRQYARIFRHRTMPRFDVNDPVIESQKPQDKTWNSLTEVDDHETTGNKKGQNFLKKLWNRIIEKSNKKKSQRDEQTVKTQKKSSKLTRLFCFCQPKTQE